MRLDVRVSIIPMGLHCYEQENSITIYMFQKRVYDGLLSDLEEIVVVSWASKVLDLAWCSQREYQLQP